MAKSKKTQSSQRWLQEHDEDMYVKRAHQEGYRSRAVYKLEQLNERDQLLRSGITVVDLGAAPGGWSQWIVRHLKANVRIFALDILPMEPLAHVNFIQGDFREQSVLDNLLNQIGNQKTNLVISDMSPNISGMKAVDQPRMVLLAELARDLAFEVLAAEGHFVTKIFQGEGFQPFMQSLRPHFKQLYTRKPAASRPRSPEIYIVAKHFLVN